MPEERKTLEEFLSTYDPDGTRTTRIKVAPHKPDDQGGPMFLFEDPEGRVAVVVPMPFGDYLDVDVHGFHANGDHAPVGVAGWNDGFQYRLSSHENAPQETGHGWQAARTIALFID